MNETHKVKTLCIYENIYVCVCMYVCVCVRARVER